MGSPRNVCTRNRARLAAALTALALTGCTGFAPRIEQAADAYDTSLGAAELWICRGASVGSVMRSYAVSDEMWASWKALCGYTGSDVDRPVPPGDTR